MEEDDDFGFTDADLMPGVEASPLPATPASPQTAAYETGHEEEKTEAEGEQPPKPTRRFNPWN